MRYLPLILLTLPLHSTRSAEPTQLQGRFDARLLPSQSTPAWRAAGRGQENVRNQVWTIKQPGGFVRALDLGPAIRTHESENIVELEWATNCRDNRHADGFCILADGKRFRIQPIHVPSGPDLLLVGTPRGLSPSISACRVSAAKLGSRFSAQRMNRYSIFWKTDQSGQFHFRLSVNGKLVGRFAGMNQAANKRTRLIFEFRSGEHSIRRVRWRLRRGGRRVREKKVELAYSNVVAGRRQLFLDDVLIEKLAGLRRVLHQPKKHAANPVIRHHQTPWQGFRAQLYGTVLYFPREQKFKMWYLAGSGFPDEPPVRVNGRLVCANFQLVGYAESRNGFDWKLPNLGLVNFNGSTKNNLCLISRENAEGIAVVYDPQTKNPRRRYKAIYWEHGVCGNRKFDPVLPISAMSVSFSADGKKWTNYKNNPVIGQASDTGHQALWDPQRKTFVALGRFGAGGRKVALSTSPDFIRWTPSQLVFACDSRDGPATQVYGMGTSHYEGVYIGLPWIYRQGTTHKIDVQLTTSRNGYRWTRVANRQTFIPNGPKGAFDAGCIFTASQPLQVVGDKIFIFYSGLMLNHDEPRPSLAERRRSKYGESSIGVATLRRDGFVSLQTTGERRSGYVVTKPVPWKSGGKLFVNVDATSGRLFATLFVNGKKVVTSHPVRGDVLREPIRWRKDVTPTEGPVTIQFTITKGAKLYSYWVR